MKPLTGTQKKYLRGMAHSLKPVVFVGQKGMSPSLIRAVNEAFEARELIKIKFNEFKEKEEKRAVLAGIEDRTGARVCGIIGHTAILYRRNPDPEKRKIDLPKGTS
ncbi:MAG: ribosome assembly RNA-binding protein YhbY [Desulfobacterales bacterium]